jgi:hypothetical protein
MTNEADRHGPEPTRLQCGLRCSVRDPPQGPRSWFPIGMPASGATGLPP